MLHGKTWPQVVGPLCGAGWEAAISALRTVELAALLREFQQPPADWSA